MDKIWFLDMGTGKVCALVTRGWGVPSTVSWQARRFRNCSWRTSNLGVGSCHSSEVASQKIEEKMVRNKRCEKIWCWWKVETLGDTETVPGCSKVVLVKFVMIGKWSEVLWRWMIWSGVVGKELCWWCVWSRGGIQMEHREVRNDLMVADELYIQREFLALVDFFFFSLYSFSWIVKQVTTLKQLQLLTHLDSLDMNFGPFGLVPRLHYS